MLSHRLDYGHYLIGRFATRGRDAVAACGTRASTTEGQEHPADVEDWVACLGTFRSRRHRLPREQQGRGRPRRRRHRPRPVRGERDGGERELPPRRPAPPPARQGRGPARTRVRARRVPEGSRLAPRPARRRSARWASATTRRGCSSRRSATSAPSRRRSAMASTPRSSWTPSSSLGWRKPVGHYVQAYEP